jgi:hypothetical protein
LHATSQPTFLLAEVYLRANFYYYYLPALLLRCRYFFFLALALSSQPPSAPAIVCPSRGLRIAQRWPRRGAKKQAPNWIRSSFDEADLKKAKKEGFLPASATVVFPSDEVVPTLPAGYRVMFLAFLLHGLYLPAHEFLCGLLFCVWRAATSAHA